MTDSSAFDFDSAVQSLFEGVSESIAALIGDDPAGFRAAAADKAQSLLSALLPPEFKKAKADHDTDHFLYHDAGAVENAYSVRPHAVQAIMLTRNSENIADVIEFLRRYSINFMLRNGKIMVTPSAFGPDSVVELEPSNFIIVYPKNEVVSVQQHDVITCHQMQNYYNLPDDLFPQVPVDPEPVADDSTEYHTFGD